MALDFFTADLLNGTKVYVLAVIEHGSRRIGPTSDAWRASLGVSGRGRIFGLWA